MSKIASALPKSTPNNDENGLRAPKRGRYLKLCLQWHWISSALAVFGMMLFSVTGITLNHAGQIASIPEVTLIEDRVPEQLVQQLISWESKESGQTPKVLSAWLKEKHGIAITRGALEWSEYELYVSSPRPGGDAWLSVDFETGDLIYEATDRGWIAWMNDLHKGRNTGAAWVWFIDLFAVICIVFCVTGFCVLWIHSRERAEIWPVVGAGVLVPVLLAVLFVH